MHTGKEIGANAIVKHVETVNGSITIHEHATVDAATTVNGSITLSNSCKMGTGSLGISAQLDAMNGQTGPTKGDLIVIHCEGPYSEQALAKLVELVEDRFGEE